MQPRTSFDPGLLIAVAVGFVSIFALGWIYLTNNRSESPIPLTEELTAVPSDSSPAQTAILPGQSATPTPDISPPAATRTSPEVYPGPPAVTLSSASTPVTENQSATSAVPTPDQVQPLSDGKYDDTDPGIEYDRFWTFRMNSGTRYAYKGTLHLSSGIGNEASFRFTGKRFYLGYQRGKDFGIVTVIIDGESYSFHEQAVGNIWRSPQLSPGIHSVRIIHESGESINLDYIEILQ